MRSSLKWPIGAASLLVLAGVPVLTGLTPINAATSGSDSVVAEAVTPVVTKDDDPANLESVTEATTAAEESPVATAATATTAAAAAKAATTAVSAASLADRLGLSGTNILYRRKREAIGQARRAPPTLDDR